MKITEQKNGHSFIITSDEQEFFRRDVIYRQAKVQLEIAAAHCMQMRYVLQDSENERRQAKLLNPALRDLKFPACVTKQ